MTGTAWTAGEGNIDVPDLIRPIRAYRFWYTSDRVPGLRSIMHGYSWDIENEAECHAANFFRGDLTRGTHEGKAPQESCSCGFYGYHLAVSAFADNTGFGGSGNVFGVFEAYGDVIMHPLGLRAQKTRIVALAPNYDEWSTPRTEIRDIVESYTDKGIRIFRSPKQLLVTYPPEDLTNILGATAEELRVEYKGQK